MVLYTGNYSSEPEAIHGEVSKAYTPSGDITKCTVLEENRVLGLGIYDGGRWIKDSDSDEY